MTADFIDNPRETANCDRCGETEATEHLKRIGASARWCLDCREDTGS